MIYPDLAPIDWANLAGGDADTTSAISARDRKLALAAGLTESILPLAERLERRGAIFECSSAVLRDEPLAARWYLDLAGLTGKTVARLRARYMAAGLPLSPETIAANRQSGREVGENALTAFSGWINETLIELYPVDGRSRALALTTVLAIMGARIDGVVRNMAGDDAVLVLKTLLVGEFSSRAIEIEVPGPGNAWETYSPAANLLEQRLIRFGGRLVCDFVPGGNRPDIRVTADGVVIFVGEVKGRSDLSNLWESWVPQIGGHLQTWAAEIPLAPRAFFGTIVTEEMIEGVTPGGTRHTGLRAFARSGILNAAYNLTNIAEGRPAALATFKNLIDQLKRNLD